MTQTVQETEPNGDTPGGIRASSNGASGDSPDAILEAAESGPRPGSRNHPRTTPRTALDSDSGPQAVRENGVIPPTDHPRTATDRSTDHAGLDSGPAVRPPKGAGPDRETRTGEAPSKKIEQVYIVPAVYSLPGTQFEAAVREGLIPFLTCDPANATDTDFAQAAARILRAAPRDPARTVTDALLDSEVCDLREHGAGAARTIKLTGRLENLRTPEALMETLNHARDVAAAEAPDVAAWIRREALAQLTRRFGREQAESILRDHFDTPPLAPAYGADGRLRSVDLSTPMETPWLVEGMIPAGTVGMWIAPYSSGKTFGAAALSLAVAFEGEWMGNPTVGGGHVRYVAAEGLASFPQRLAAWMVHNGHLADGHSSKDLAAALAGRISVNGGNVRLDDPRLEEVLVRSIQADGTRLLVLDTLGRLLGAGQSEDDNNVANAVTGTLQRVAQETDCTIMLIHHPGHKDQDRGRGASAWAQAADWVIVSRGNPNLGSVRLMNTKQRDADLFADVAYRLRSVPMTRDGKAQTSAVFEPCAVGTAEEVSLPWRIRLYVQAYPGASVRAIRAKVQGTNQEITDEVAAMVAEGKLLNRGKGNIYALHDNPEAWPHSTDEFNGNVDLSDVSGGAE